MHFDRFYWFAIIYYIVVQEHCNWEEWALIKENQLHHNYSDRTRDVIIPELRSTFHHCVLSDWEIISLKCNQPICKSVIIGHQVQQMNKHNTIIVSLCKMVLVVMRYS